jgi:glucosamine-6-phosphate deaminase
MQIIIVEDKKQVAKKAFEIIKETIQSQTKPVLGLATGSTPIELYNQLIQANQNKELSFKDVFTYNLDEYVGLDATHPQSYAYFMRENLFNHIDINQENTNLPQGDAKDLQQECDRYDALVKSMVADVQVLGIGTNGHIAFNEPGSSFDSTTHVIELTKQTREDNARFFEDEKDVPTHAITMGISSILIAKKIILMATSLNKADAVKQMIEGVVDTKCPATILQNHPDVVVIIDKEAASKLV